MNTLSHNELRKAGIATLVKELGPVGMICFLQLFVKGEGDYTLDRVQWLADLAIDEIVKEVEKVEKAVRAAFRFFFCKVFGAGYQLFPLKLI